MTAQAYATVLDPVRPPEPRVLRPVDVDAAADAARMLAALHERVERQFAAVATALATHVAVEDELVYPALRDHTGRHDAEVERQLQQDHLLDLVMVELGGMIPSDRGYDGKVRVLMQVFRQHARDAEALIGQHLRRYLGPGERERLGLRMLERVGQLEGRPRPGW
jgi:Hemerythrin HHE cation binding domain